VGAVLLCNYFRHQELIWPAIGLAVSLHFAPFARLFHMRAYYVTACIGALVSIVALCAPLGPMRLVWLGSGMAAAMWGTAFYLVKWADAIAASSLAVFANDTINA
jgi:predicted membrane channel-forming protein YqfA (hemolysin III family)